MRAKQRVPERLVRAAARFAAWRRTHVPHSRIPRFLWNVAVNLAKEFGVSRTAITLRLNYGDLRKRFESKRSSSRRVLPAEPNSFVELPASAFPTPGECLIELENTTGSKMRIQLKGPHGLDLVELSDTFLNMRR